jgi:hypothetical protein
VLAIGLSKNYKNDGNKDDVNKHKMTVSLGNWPLPVVGGRQGIAPNPNQAIFLKKTLKSTLTNECA